MKHLKIAFVAMVVFTAVFGGLYPVVMWGLGTLLFPHQARGSLLIDPTTKKTIGSSLLGQSFQGARYFHPRPSAAGKNGYDAMNSSGSNLGPTSQALSDRVRAESVAYRLENRLPLTTRVPADAVAASGSGLDPHISVQNARLQAGRVAKARGISAQVVEDVIDECMETPFFDILGEKRVNVLKINLALDNTGS